MTAAIPKERTNDSWPAARPPAGDTNRAAGSLNAPPYLATAAGMFVATSTQASVSFLPISGSSASHGGGAARVRLGSGKPTISEYREDASDATPVAIATNITATPTSPISSADQRLPSRTAKRRCSGYSITARIVDQIRRSLKGCMYRLQA